MVCPTSRNETHQIYRSYNNIFIKLFQKFCNMTEYGPEEVEPLDTAEPEMYKKTPRCYQTSRWSHGFRPPGARSGTPPTLPRRSPRTSSTKSAKKGPVVYLSLHRTEWMAPAIQDQPLVPQA